MVVLIDRASEMPFFILLSHIRMTTSSKWLALSLLTLSACDARLDTTAEKQVTPAGPAAATTVAKAPAHPSQSLTLTPEETAVFNIRLAQAVADAPESRLDLRNIQNLTGGVIGLSAAQLQEEYDQNAASADQRYRDNIVLVSGHIDKVGGNETKYYVGFKGQRGSINRPQAEMEPGHVAFLTRLEQGQRVTLACIGAGTSMGDAKLIGCVPSQAFARAIVAAFLKRTPVSDLMNGPNSWLRQEMILAVAYASELPKDSTCGEVDMFNERCVSLVKSIGSDYADKSANVSGRMTEFAFKRLGIKDW